MDNCPWCGNQIDGELLWINGDVNNDGYFECPHCGGQLEIYEQVEYSYLVSRWPAISEDDNE